MVVKNLKNNKYNSNPTQPINLSIDRKLWQKYQPTFVLICQIETINDFSAFAFGAIFSCYWIFAVYDNASEAETWYQSNERVRNVSLPGRLMSDLLEKAPAHQWWKTHGDRAPHHLLLVRMGLREGQKE